ncbi:MAG: hypothetical protein V2B20_16675 [Pseudomonadota bacterium]
MKKRFLFMVKAGVLLGLVTFSDLSPLMYMLSPYFSVRRLREYFQPLRGNFQDNEQTLAEISNEDHDRYYVELQSVETHVLARLS